MKKLSKTSIDYYLLPNKIICGIAGIWPIDEKSSKRNKVFAYFRLIFGFTSVGSIFVPEIMAIVLHWGDIRILAEVGSVLTTLSQCLFKMIYLIARKERTYKFFNEVRSLWDSSEDPKERQSYEKFVYWSRICTLIFSSFGAINIATFSTVATVNYFRIQYDANNSYKNRHLPFNVWYGTDISASPKFEIAFIYQVITSSVCAAGVCGLDATFMTAILHVSGQFKLINTWITNIGTEIRYESYYPPKLEADLIRCIRHHQRMINVVNDMNNLLTPIVFVQLFTSGIEICLSGYAAIQNGTMNADLLKTTIYLISMAAQLIVWCLPGEILAHQSQQIGHAIYLNVPWYSLPAIYQKHLCLMIIRAQQYCAITALTFETLCLHTLTNVFNTAASYFTLLRGMQQK